MKLNCGTPAKIGFLVAASVLISLAQAQERGAGQVGSGPAPGPQVGPGARGFVNMDPVDDRVQQRTYLFADTDENLPYAVFVPSRYSKGNKAALVLALHGMNGSHRTFMRTSCVDEAEKHGFILVGPMGYSSTGSFGMPMGARGRTGGPGRGGPSGPGGPGAPGATDGAAPQAQPGAVASRGDQTGRAAARGPGMGMPEPGGTKETDRAKVAELSERDAMNVLAMVRKEFNVDDGRIYLMGHSLGGGGVLHMGEKYSTVWAGVAALAPAAFGIQWTADSKLRDVPLLIVQGDGDTLVRPAGSQQLAEQLKGLGFQCDYKLLPGLDHGGIIGGSMPDVFAFFAAHTRGSK